MNRAQFPGATIARKKPLQALLKISQRTARKRAFYRKKKWAYLDPRLET